MAVSSRIYATIARHRRLVLFAFAVAVAVCGALASRIRLDGDMLNMLPDDIPAVKTVRKLQGWSPHFAANMYLGMVRDDATSVETLKAFAEQVGTELAKSQWVSPGLVVAMDIGRVQKAMPLFLDAEDVGLVGKELDRAVKARRKQGSGFYLELDEAEGESPEDLLRPLLPKYLGRLQSQSLEALAQTGDEGAPGTGDAALKAAIARARLKLDAGGTRLYYISPDGKMLAFVFEPVFQPYELEHYPDLIADVDAAIARARTQVPGSQQIDVYKGGAYPLQWDQRETTLADALRSSVAAGLLIVLVIVVTIRRLRLVGLVVTALLVGLVVCAGLSYLAVGKVNVITVFLLAVLAGLGIDFGLYLTTRYSLFLRAGLGREDATREAWMQTASPAFMGAVTTTMVMLVLAFGRFQGFADLGIICAVGIIAIYLSMYVLLPALFLSFGRRTNTAGVSAEVARDIVAEALERGSTSSLAIATVGPAQRVVLIASAALTVFALIGIPRVRFAYTGEELTVKNQRSLEIDRLILKHFGENVDQTVVLADTEEKARRIHEYFEQNYGKFSTIARYESLFTYYPPPQRQAAALDEVEPLTKALSRLPGKSEDPDAQFALDLAKRMADPEPITLEDVPPFIRKVYSFTDDNGKPIGYMGAIYASKWLWDYDALEKFVDEVEGIRVDGQPLEVTGRAQIFYRLVNIVRDESELFSAIGLAMIFFVFWVQARSLRFALLAMLPLLLGVTWLLGIMPFLGSGDGMTLNFVNVIAFPILTGLGVSYGVQVVFAYRIYGAAARALQVLFRPVMGSALTTMIGWGSLLLASMNGMRSIGWVSVLGMAFITTCSLVTLPAVLASLHRRGFIKPNPASGG